MSFHNKSSPQSSTTLNFVPETTSPRKQKRGIDILENLDDIIAKKVKLEIDDVFLRLVSLQEKEICDLKEEVSVLREKVDNFNDEVTNLNKEIAHLNKHIDKQECEIAQLKV